MGGECCRLNLGRLVGWLECSSCLVSECFDRVSGEKGSKLELAGDRGCGVGECAFMLSLPIHDYSYFCVCIPFHVVDKVST